LILLPLVNLCDPKTPEENPDTKKSVEKLHDVDSHNIVCGPRTVFNRDFGENV
jgi:hypothetical protein